MHHVVDLPARCDVGRQRERFAAMSDDLPGVLFAPSPLMSAHTTFAPSRAKILAAARPMPLAAPVMMIVLPTK